MVEVEANIVQDFRIGHTRVMIADNYCCDKTQNDVEAILTRIAKMAQSHINAAATAGMYEQTKEIQEPTTEIVCGFDVYSCISRNSNAST